MKKMLTYADIEKAFRVERSNSVLQKLEADFYEQGLRLSESPEVGEYGDSIREHLEKIYLARVNKIIHHAGRSDGNPKPPDNILSDEEALYSEIVSAVNRGKARILGRRFEPERPTVEQEKVAVRFTKALPAIVAPDGTEYGPFREDDIEELPASVAELLVSKKAAEPA